MSQLARMVLWVLTSISASVVVITLGVAVGLAVAATATQVVGLVAAFTVVALAAWFAGWFCDKSYGWWGIELKAEFYE